MKIGITSGSFGYLPLEKRYLRIRELGYDAVDQDLADTKAPYYRDAAAMEEHCKAVRAAAEAAGLEISQVHGPWPTDDTTAENRAETLGNMRLAVYGCHCLGSPYLIIHPQMPYGWGHEEDADFALSLTVELMKALMPDCEKYGVTLCLENMPMTAHRISTMDRIAEAVALVNHPNAGICLDTGHTNVYGHDLGDAVRTAGTYLRTLHVHDNDGRADRHQLPYLGTADWSSFTAALAETGFSGVLSLETGGVSNGRMPFSVRDAADRLTAAVARALAEQATK
ncbi:MAG: sugar phosphate isomerase/epimerase [Clostridia bacterium]|nr:sugar phosphate isomerase/epimerase [Clostridia bacterium]